MHLIVNKTTLCIIAFSILLIALLPLSAQALSTDRDQPAEIEADDIEFDFKKGVRTYLHNVLVVQGTLRIKADKMVTLYNADGDLDTATAWGSLARFKQRPDGKENDVEGWAKKIVVDQKRNLLTLVGKAALRQGADTARGSTIIYNMANDTLQVKGGAKVGAAGKAGASKPKRTIEDPFKDNNQGPAEPAKLSDTKQTESVDEELAETDTEAQEPEQEPQVEPARSGRSRLIIQPK